MSIQPRVNSASVPSGRPVWVKSRRVPVGMAVADLTFPAEGYGFVKFENNKRALEVELNFTARVFGFELADPMPPVEIENL